MEEVICDKRSKTWLVDEKDFVKLIVCPYCGQIINPLSNKTEDLVQTMFMLIRNKEFETISKEQEFLKI